MSKRVSDLSTEEFESLIRNVVRKIVREELNHQPEVKPEDEPEDETPPKESITIGIIPASLSKPITIKTVKISNLCTEAEKIVGGSVEAHVTAYYMREHLPKEFQKMHENICFYCDEEGCFKPGLQFNKRASHISGLQVLGTVVIFLEDGENETYLDITKDDLDRLWEHTKTHKVY